MLYRDTIPRQAVPYEAADFAAGLRALLSMKTPSTTGFDILLGDCPKFWAASGRQALLLLLRALRLKLGSQVVTPLYSDAAVAAAIIEAGYKPLFVDVDPGTFTLDPSALGKVIDKASAVVAVHFFGRTADIPKIIDIAAGRPVIEDTIHAPLSYFGGRMTGTFGAGRVHSFGSSKYWPAGGGGLAVVNDPALALNVAEEARKLRPARWLPSVGNLLGQTAKALVFERRVYSLAGRHFRPLLESRALLEPHFDPEGISPGQAAVALRQARRLPDRVHAQRLNSLKLLSLLDGLTDIVLPVEGPEERWSYHFFPVLAASEAERDALRAALLQQGVDTSRNYFNIVDLSRDFGYSGGCPVSESVARRILTLPSYASLSTQDIERVAASFIAALRTYRSGRSVHASSVSRVSSMAPRADVRGTESAAPAE